jgi:hypothetical protein
MRGHAQQEHGQGEGQGNGNHGDMLQCISPTKIGVRLQSGNEAGNGAGRDIPASATPPAPVHPCRYKRR